MAEERLMAGKYQLLRKIAQGGMAEVYLCKQKGLEGFEKLVVIKRILPHLVANQEFVRMFLDEARTAADLRHPNVVQIFEIGEDQGTYFIAMEFLHGQDVRKVLRRQAELGGYVPPAHALQIIIDAANGLDYAHKKSDLNGRPLGIIHRDISPQNIIVTFDGTTKIVDFGIAKAASQSVETKSGVLKGKYSYMSPEQASGDTLDQRTDQFALGIVLYELTTMTRLFKRENEIMTLHAIIECEVKPPHELNPDYPRALSNIVMKTLSRRRQDRFKDCRALAEALEEWLADERVLHSPARLAGYMQEQFKKELAEEKTLGMPVLEEAQSTAEVLRTGRGARNTAATPARPGDDPDVQNAGTQVSQSDVAPSSASRRGARPQSPDQPTRLSTTGSIVAAAADPTSRRGLMVLGTVLGLALLAGVGGTYAYLNANMAENLAVRSDPSGAQVWMDGELQQGRTPLIVPDLPREQSHAFKVGLLGYMDEVFTLEAGSTAMEQSVSLKKASPRALLRLKTTPPGARAYLDGQLLEGVTPLELPPMEVDKEAHSITFSLEGFEDGSRSIKLKEGVQEVSAVLDAAAGDDAVLNITSEPDGAIITVGGKPAGTAPLGHVKVPGGRSVTVAAKLAGHLTQERILDVASGDVLDVAFELEKEAPAEVAYLNITTVPDTTVMTEKGRQLGRSPTRRAKVPAGSVTLRLVNAAKGIDYTLPEPWKVAVDEEVTRTIKIPRSKLRVSAKGAWADVYLDGTKLGTTPFAAKDVFLGRHEIRLVNAKLGKDEKRVILVEPGDKNLVKVEW